MLTAAKPVLEAFAGIAGYPQKNHSTQGRTPGRTPAAFRSRSVRRVLAQVAARPFASHSDSELRNALINLQLPALHHGAERLDEDHQAAVFALADESISRRLGAWRIFDPSFDLKELEAYHTIAHRVMDSGQYIAFNPSSFILFMVLFR